jgi:hypothetical protein
VTVWVSHWALGFLGGSLGEVVGIGVVGVLWVELVFYLWFWWLGWLEWLGGLGRGDILNLGIRVAWDGLEG